MNAISVNTSKMLKLYKSQIISYIRFTYFKIISYQENI